MLLMLSVHPSRRSDLLGEDKIEFSPKVQARDFKDAFGKRRSATLCSNRSLRCGKRNFQGRDKEAETALEIQGRRCRDKISLGNPANSGLLAGKREISVRTRMRGGAERSPTMGKINERCG